MIKAIETEYDGYKFRSRTEARWAVYFDSLPTPLKWVYEAEGYDLDGTWYLPDFWLPEISYWAEVKGGEFTKEEKDKCRKLTEMTGFPCLLLTGAPDVRAYLTTGGDALGIVNPIDCGGHGDLWSFGGAPYYDEVESYTPIVDAVKASRTYSFWK